MKNLPPYNHLLTTIFAASLYLNNNKFKANKKNNNTKFSRKNYKDGLTLAPIRTFIFI